MTDKNQTIVNPPVIDKATKSQKIEYVIYFIFGAVEILLAFRLVFKLMGASLASGFVRFIYTLTGIFVMPFNGIFSKGYTQGLEISSVLEPATIVAIVVYIIIAWGIVKLVRITSG
jgi:hypothetical protein